MNFGNPFYNSQSQTDTASAGGVRLVRSIKSFKHVREVPRGYTNSVVNYAYDDRFTGLLGQNFGMTVFIAVNNGIFDQIDQHFFQIYLVPQNNHGRYFLGSYGNIFFIGKGIASSNNSQDKRSQIHFVVLNPFF